MLAETSFYFSVSVLVSVSISISSSVSRVFGQFGSRGLWARRTCVTGPVPRKLAQLLPVSLATEVAAVFSASAGVLAWPKSPTKNRTLEPIVEQAASSVILLLNCHLGSSPQFPFPLRFPFDHRLGLMDHCIVAVPPLITAALCHCDGQLALRANPCPANLLVRFFSALFYVT